MATFLSRILNNDSFKPKSMQIDTTQFERLTSKNKKISIDIKIYAFTMANHAMRHKIFGRNQIDFKVKVQKRQKKECLITI